MKKDTIGQSGLEGSRLVLGTWAIGGSEWGGTDARLSLEAIESALEAGIDFIDTAPIYGKGLSEEIVGQAIKGRRDDVVLATKVGLRWDTTEGEFSFKDNDGVAIYRNLKAASIRYEVEQSLRRLGVDCIDLLQTHWPDTTTPIAETMETLLALKAEGKVRALGACNISSSILSEYLDVGTLDSIQEMYSMLDRKLEQDLLPMAQKEGLSALAYSPLAMGLLSGKVGPERTFPEDDIRSWSPRFSVECRTQIAALLKQFQPIAESYEMSIAQLVIAWTLAQPMITHVLTGVRSSAQVEENVVPLHRTLADADVAELNSLLKQANLQMPHPFGADA